MIYAAERKHFKNQNRCNTKKTHQNTACFVTVPFDRAMFTSVGESLSDSMSDTQESPETCSLSSFFTASTTPAETQEHL